jgi:hypothetical protein
MMSKDQWSSYNSRRKVTTAQENLSYQNKKAQIEHFPIARASRGNQQAPSLNNEYCKITINKEEKVTQHLTTDP